MQRDAEPDHLNVPHPELYYLDQEDGSRMLIWPPEETLPRDVLAHRPEVWLHTALHTSTATATATITSLLPHFLEHYSRLGIAPERMIFTIHHNPTVSDDVDENSSVLYDMLQAIGADYRLWIGEHSPATAYRATLQALSRVPIQDWILHVDIDEFLDFGGLSALRFLGKCERDGANWATARRVLRMPTTGASNHLPAAPDMSLPLWSQYPLGCKIGTDEIIIAYRGFLRATPRRQAIIEPEHAAGYLGIRGRWQKDAVCDTAPEQHVGVAGSEHHISEKDVNVAVLTPYHIWWQYYRTKSMVGNAYLWFPRKALLQNLVLGDSTSHHVILHCCGLHYRTLEIKAGRECSSSMREFTERGNRDIAGDPHGACASIAGPVELPSSRDAALALLDVQRHAQKGSQRT